MPPILSTLFKLTLVVYTIPFCSGLPLTQISLLQTGGIPSYSGYSLTWGDGFNGVNGTPPSSANWLYDVGNNNGYGNGEQEFYTSLPANCYQDGLGNLQFVPFWDGVHWTSARLESTRADFQAQPNKKLRIEASIMLPVVDPSKEKGIWPAFWALGSSIRHGGSWPAVGEWDIFETVNGQSTAYGTLHCGSQGGGSYGGPCNEPNGLGAGINFQRGQYHVHRLEVDRTPSNWQQETVTWYLDGQQYWQVSGARIGDPNIWGAVAHSPFFLLANIAIGGGWPGSYDHNTLGGIVSGMSLQYVAVYNSI